MDKSRPDALEERDAWEGSRSDGSPTTTSSMESDAFGAYSSGERTRSFLKVQDGCDNFCAYCTVPYARGRSRSLPICECVKMAQAIAAEGVKEVVLTGVNTGDFGRTTGESFLDLLKALNEVEGIERYRISSIEPNLITPKIVLLRASVKSSSEILFSTACKIAASLRMQRARSAISTSTSPFESLP